MIKNIRMLATLVFVTIISLSIGKSVKADSLPTFRLPGLTTSKIQSSESLKGQLVYLDFWASWCPPCVKSLPFLEKIQKQYGGEKFQVVAINIDQNKEDAIAFLKDHQIQLESLYDPKGILGKPMQVSSMPTAFLISPEGQILMKHVGFNQDYAKKLENQLPQLINSF